MIKESFYKDRPAVEVSCERFRALFLPKDGAKLASFITRGGKELFAQTEGEKYRRLFIDSDYVKAECSAFDDMFPTIDPCEINGLQYPDHGEVCRREHNVQIDGGTATFSCELPSFKVRYQKTVRVEDGALVVGYVIENRGDRDLPYLWAGHMMFRGESGAYAECNFPAGAPRMIMFGTPADENLLHVLPEMGNGSYKYYYRDAHTPLECGVVLPESGVRVKLEFDNDVVKYFGVWMNPGYLNGMYNLALEPCTALYDSPVRAEAAGAASYIKAGETVAFSFRLSYEE